MTTAITILFGINARVANVLVGVLRPTLPVVASAEVESEVTLACKYGAVAGQYGEQRMLVDGQTLDLLCQQDNFERLARLRDAQ